MKELEQASPRESYVETDVETASEASSEQDYSYEFAQMEVIMKTLGNNGTIRIISLQFTQSFSVQFSSCKLDFVCRPHAERSPSAGEAVPGGETHSSGGAEDDVRARAGGASATVVS